MVNTSKIMRYSILIIFQICIFILTNLSGCCPFFSIPAAYDTPTSTITRTPRPTRTLTVTPTPTETPTLTSTPTPTFTPTPPLLVLAGTPLAESLPPITLENVSQVSGLAEWYESAVTDMEWLPDGRLLAVANTATINIYDISSRELLRTLYPQREGIVNIAISPNGLWLVSGMLRGSEKAGYATSIELWQGPDWKPLGVLFGLSYGLTDMIFSPDGMIFTTAYASPVSRDNRVDFWSAITWNTIGLLEIGPALQLAFSPDSNLFATSPNRYKIQIWDIKEQKFSFEFNTSFTGAVNALAFSPDGVTLASGHYDGAIRFWDLRTGVTVLTSNTDEVIQSMVFSPDGRILATGGSFQNSLIRLWSAGTGTLLRTLEGHTNGVSNLAFSPDSQHLVSASYDGTIRLWGIRSY